MLPCCDHNIPAGKLEASEGLSPKGVPCMCARHMQKLTTLCMSFL